MAWLTLDSDDNELSRFIRYAFAALQTAEPGLVILAIETADKMTDRQIAAKVREHFLTESASVK